MTNKGKAVKKRKKINLSIINICVIGITSLLSIAMGVFQFFSEHFTPEGLIPVLLFVLGLISTSNLIERFSIMDEIRETTTKNNELLEALKKEVKNHKELPAKNGTLSKEEPK
ncbi:MAG: hypothetical protein LBM77_13560 [Spirochaetaceae bacterium]|nr:hypothetical protein [Spirochaetaceae bacterium]